jgi:TetR/AcrR family transcriptional regulator, regulator of cefoperazone and chloramphenicol sensitivity
MKAQREDAVRTKKSLLAAAGEVFAEKGYRDATIAEICEQAKANVAAVNYHFGDKETLYIEAWRHSFSCSLKTHPPDGGVSEDARPEERLRGQVEALLHRMADKNNKEFLIVHRELANPTGLLEEVMRRDLRPLRDKMETVIRELLGPATSDMQARFCAIGVVSQCISPILISRMKKMRPKDKDDSPRIDDIDSYANHVVKFSLAGIAAIREEAKEKRRNPGSKRRSGRNQG